MVPVSWFQGDLPRDLYEKNNLGGSADPGVIRRGRRMSRLQRGENRGTLPGTTGTGEEREEISQPTEERGGAHGHGPATSIHPQLELKRNPHSPRFRGLPRAAKNKNGKRGSQGGKSQEGKAVNKAVG